MLSIFSCICRPSVCLLWRNVYIGLLFIWWWWWFVFVLFFFFIFSFMSLVALFASIFSQSMGCHFILFMVSFTMQQLLSLIRSHLLIFVFISNILGSGSQRIPFLKLKSIILIYFILFYLNKLHSSTDRAWILVINVTTDYTNL